MIPAWKNRVKPIRRPCCIGKLIQVGLLRDTTSAVRNLTSDPIRNNQFNGVRSFRYVGPRFAYARLLAFE
jgi:hypothetical protein